jgi:Uma2 family endonuclease
MVAVQAEVKRRRFTVDEYYRMAEAGILKVGEHVELIEGDVVTMCPIGSWHASGVDRLNYGFSTRLAGRALVRVQSPIRLSDNSEPEPDIALLRLRDDFYATAHPFPADVLLVVQVADTSLRFDRDTKISLYAASGIPEVWLVDLEASQVTVYRDPHAGGYRSVRVHEREASIAPTAFPDIVVPCAEILPSGR